MKKRVKSNLLIAAILVLIIIILFFIDLKLTGNIIQDQKQQVQFYFYDESTDCSLDGYVFSGDKPIGKSINGIFNLTYSNYMENIDKNNIQEISIFGKLGNCFNQDSNNQNQDLFFDKTFLLPEIGEYHFIGESLFNFKTKINPNNPTNKELQGFIQPNNANSELNNIQLENKNTLNSLSAINNYLNNKIEYKQDWDFNKEENYWQTPKETLTLNQGDCEDYSTSLLSLFLAYNNSLNCYNVIFTSHVTTLCHIEDYYVYYDQGKTELKTKINNQDDPTQTTPAGIKIKIENLKQDYFKHYGINDPDTTAYYAFNNIDYVEFNNNENDDSSFIHWQYNLKNIKQTNQDIFSEIERELIRNTQNTPTSEIEQGELRTQTISLPNSKPFPYFIIIPGIIAISILVVLLVRVNKKK